MVRIFRKHNFAWGGNFLAPDGMHFEWVGEPRNTYQYPSRFCPNVPSGGIEIAVGGTGPIGPHRARRRCSPSSATWVTADARLTDR